MALKRAANQDNLNTSVSGDFSTAAKKGRRNNQSFDLRSTGSTSNKFMWLI